MSLMTWSESLSVNIKEIDAQHRKLVDMLNDLHDAMKKGKGRDMTGKVLSGLVHYVGTHFSTEEKLMKQYAFHEYLQHKEEHEVLTKQVLDLYKQFQEGRPVITIGLMKFLKDWLSNHILGTDKKYMPYLNSKGVQ